MIVCIAEKPSVAAEIAKVLGAKSKKDGYFEGNGYQVTWTFGHLCELKEPHEYNPEWKHWKLEYLPMIPDKYGINVMPDKGVRHQFKVIKDLYKKANTIVNCGDAGQEGELIQRWVMELAGVKCPVKRLWISSLTEEAIRDGFQHLHDQRDYDSLYQAGLARAEGDWLLGMNATRLYTMKYGGHKQILSIGRVQTPTLSMIVARDREIENFKPTPYWVLNTKYRAATFACTQDKFVNEEEARRCLRQVEGQRFVITDIKEKRGSEQPPQLYDLTALQVDCNKKYGMSADQTLKTIQSLYEKKLTTYPRVDTKFLTDDIYTQCPGIIQRLSGMFDIARPLVGSQLPKSKRVFDNGKVTDHHAIIPTGETGGITSLNQYEKKVYELIVKRFLAVFYPDCQYNQTAVLAESNGVPFKATGRTILNEGWRAVYAKTSANTANEEDEDEDKEKEAVLPKFTVNESGQHTPSLERKMTTPPKRFTEASLLQSMETAGKMVNDEELREAMKENGIGRPSSRAGIIETLLKRGYIERQKKNLVSTPTGRSLVNVIEFDLLKSPELTGQWEKKLRDIEKGKFSLIQFMKELEEQLRSIIHQVNNDASGVRISMFREEETAPFRSYQRSTSSYGSTRSGSTSSKSSARSSSRSVKKVNVGDRCPECGKGFVRKGPYGLFCSEYKSGCKYRGK